MFPMEELHKVSIVFIVHELCGCVWMCVDLVKKLSLKLFYLQRILLVVFPKLPSAQTFITHRMEANFTAEIQQDHTPASHSHDWSSADS